MKFYEVPVYVRQEESDKITDDVLGKVVIKKSIDGCKESISDIYINTLDYNDSLEKNAKDALATYGFYIYCYKNDLINKNYAKVERVEEYINNFENHEFKKFIDDNEYVYGKDHRKVKKLLKKSKRTI